ncbi:MAG: LysR family transcriptional regulator [Enterobacter asburiae]|nr:LysR family transcriptional regulator [Enterobacter asburiae]
MRPNMLEYMDIFVRVVELNSFTRAAEQLQTHRPSISKAITRLESELGVKLLHRTTRKLQLTDEGHAFYERSKLLLNEAAELMASYSSGQHPHGRLRVDSPLALTHTMLIPALGDFQQRYPDIDVVLTSTDRKIDFLSEGIDCVIRLGKLEDSSFISRRLGSVQLMTCAAPSYLEKYGQPQTLDQLQDHKAVNFFSRNSREVMDWQFIVEGKVVNQKVKSSILVDNSDTFLTSALNGLGLIQGISVALAPHIASGALVPVLSQYPCAPKDVSVLFPDRRYLPPKVRVFIDWFSDVFSRYQG